jgi:hypothetical protein
MPIQVHIEINGNPIETIHIGRDSGLPVADSLNTYLVLKREALSGTSRTSRAYDPTLPSFKEWTEKGIPFTHLYGDGLTVCVEKALKALNNDENI